MYGYVYITINNINQKKYIGQHKSETFDESYKGSGKILKLAFIKYGKSNFSTQIIEKCYSKEELDNKEKYWIKYYNADLNNDFYNIKTGGNTTGGLRGINNGRYGKPVSNETREKISKANKGKKRSPEYSKKMQNIKIGKKIHSEEHKKELSIKMSGSGNPMYNNHDTRYKMTNEIRNKISETKKKRYVKEKHPMFGKKRSESTRNKISQSRKGKYCGGKNPKAKKIFCVELNMEFKCIKDAAEFLNIPYSTLSKKINNTYKGYTLVHLDNHENGE